MSTSKDFADSDIGRELIARLQTAETTRASALAEAVMLDRNLPIPVVPDQMASCPHRANMDDCDCPQPTADQMAGMARIVEEATVKRVMRNAERFYDWIRHGLTPERAQDYELRDLQDSGD